MYINDACTYMYVATFYSTESDVIAMYNVVLLFYPVHERIKETRQVL